MMKEQPMEIYPVLASIDLNDAKQVKKIQDLHEKHRLEGLIKRAEKSTMPQSAKEKMILNYQNQLGDMLTTYMSGSLPEEKEN